MPPQRILISYFFGNDMIPLGASCARSFEHFGWTVERFCSQTESAVDKWLLKYANKFLRAFGLKSIELGRESRFGKFNHKKNEMRKAVMRFHPDWVLVIRSHEFVDAAFVGEMKSQLGVKRVIGWRVDGPTDGPDLLQDAEIYDEYFCTHRHGYNPERDGIHHLPAFGVDAELYRAPATKVEHTHEIVFVGGSNARRLAIVDQLLDFPIELYGGWLRKKNRFRLELLKRVKGRGVWGEELVALYHSSKIVLNISAWDPVQYGVLNLRVFDVPATGAFLLSDYSPELETYYKIGEEIVCFRTVEELREQLRYYLDHPEERAAIAARGHQRALTLPTVTDRVRQMIATVEAGHTASRQI